MVTVLMDVVLAPALSVRSGARSQWTRGQPPPGPGTRGLMNNAATGAAETIAWSPGELVLVVTTRLTRSVSRVVYSALS